MLHTRDLASLKIVTRMIVIGARFQMKIAMSQLILEMSLWKGVPKIIVLMICKITFLKTQLTNYCSARQLIAPLAWKVPHRQISNLKRRMPLFKLNFSRGSLIRCLRVKVGEFKMCGIKPSKLPNPVSTPKRIR